MSKLSKYLEGKYEMVGVKPGPIRLKNGLIVDTTTCEASMADKAIKAGTKFIRKVEKKDTKTSDTKKKADK